MKRETEKQGNREIEKQRNRETKKKRKKETEEQMNRETEEQRNREAKVWKTTIVDLKTRTGLEVFFEKSFIENCFID